MSDRPAFAELGRVSAPPRITEVPECYGRWYEALGCTYDHATGQGYHLSRCQFVKDYDEPSPKGSRP